MSNIIWMAPLTHTHLHLLPRTNMHSIYLTYTHTFFSLSHSQTYEHTQTLCIHTKTISNSSRGNKKWNHGEILWMSWLKRTIDKVENVCSITLFWRNFNLINLSKINLILHKLMMVNRLTVNWWKANKCMIYLEWMNHL